MKRFFVRSFVFAFAVVLASVGAHVLGQVVAHVEHQGAGTASSPYNDGGVYATPAGAKYFVIVSHFGTGEIRGRIILDGPHGAVIKEVPDAYADYFAKAKEGQSLRLPPHAREWQNTFVTYGDGYVDTLRRGGVHHEPNWKPGRRDVAIFLFDDPSAL